MGVRDVRKVSSFASTRWLKRLIFVVPKRSFFHRLDTAGIFEYSSVTVRGTCPMLGGVLMLACLIPPPPRTKGSILVRPRVQGARSGAAITQARAECLALTETLRPIG